MTSVLDLDLDFFLTDVCPLSEEGERPEASCAAPWAEEEVRSFLEKTLKLSKTRPIPGRVFETHDRALDFWEMLLKDGVIEAPFHVTHVDAHTDLGIAERGYPFVRHTVLAKPVPMRAQIGAYREMHKLTEANYLSFALAFRWVSSLTNVRIPPSKPDFPAEMLSPEGDGIRLFTAFPALFEAKNGQEPLIAYTEARYPEAFGVPDRFSAMSLAVSPRYTPSAADKLIPIISEYMRLS